jgi:hypothetical protein
VLAPHQLGLLTLDHRRTCLGFDSEAPQWIHDFHTAAGNGTHGELFVAGYTELAHHEDV